MGLDCCCAGARFLKDVAGAQLLVDPFCGHGTMLAMANAIGLNSLGVEISKRRCMRAKSLNLSSKMHLVSKGIAKINTGPEYKVKSDVHVHRGEAGSAAMKAEDTRAGAPEAAVDAAASRACGSDVSAADGDRG